MGKSQKKETKTTRRSTLFNANFRDGMIMRKEKINGN